MSARRGHRRARGRWLNGWRQLWVVWALACGPIAFYGASQLGDRGKSRDLADLHAAARTSAFERAYVRIANDPLPFMTAGRGFTPTSEATVRQRYFELISRPDSPLRAELDAIDRDFEPRIREARDNEQQTFWLRCGVGWLVLSLVPYFGGATIAWMRRR